MIQLIHIRTKGRHQVDAVAQRTQQNAPIKEEGAQAGSEVGQIPCVLRDQVNRYDCAKLPGIFEGGMKRQFSESLRHILFERGDADEHILFAPDGEVGRGRRAGDGVRCVAGRMVEKPRPVL